MIIPKIVVKSWQIAEEEELFLRFLKHPEFPTHRQLILNIFPELAKELENAPDEKIAVRAFLIKFDRTHRKAITHIVHNNRSIVAKQSKKALRALGNAMEHKWLKPITYSVIPTILPFSPYGTNHFNFSIIGYILNKKQHDVLMVAVHEISHFIFFNLLKNIEQERKIELPKQVKHFLKEALTAAIFNEEPLKHILKIKEHKGNPEIQGLYVKWASPKPILLTDVIRGYYRRARKNKTPFTRLLAKLAVAGYKNQNAFIKKRALWDRYGQRILTEPRVRKQYSAPIIIKK